MPEDKNNNYVYRVKVKDLTSEDIDKFCVKYENCGGCKKCPLYKGGRFICSAKEYLEMEVEIEGE